MSEELSQDVQPVVVDTTPQSEGLEVSMPAMPVGKPSKAGKKVAAKAAPAGVLDAEEVSELEAVAQAAIAEGRKAEVLSNAVRVDY